jgi:hypothetical protein
MATQHDANNRRSIDGDSAESRIACEKFSNVFPIITLGDLEPFNALPKLKRWVIIADAKLSDLDRVPHVVRLWFHLDQPDPS